ncbi:MAG TPA: hypothetical protein VLQ45_01930 [Thermoanaerobaculia bacterium]|nr:hypothetical protein [Thermoanaerobaculia bacterium]
MQYLIRAFAVSALCLSCAAPEPQNGLALQSSPPPVPAAKAAPAPAPPGGASARVALTVRETAGVGRAGEVVRSGVPLPRSLGVRDVRGLAVVDPGGRPVPADFAVLARWNAGKDDATAPVQWLLVSFPATVPADKSAVYTLVTDGSAGSNPAPPVAVKLTREGGQVVVDTGAAVFRLGKDAGALFDEISVGGKRVVTGSEMTLRAGGAAGRHAKVRKLRVEHAGPLSAVVLVDGAYGLPPLGKGEFSSRRRYVFTAGSPTAVVRHAVAWEGNLGCQGCSTTDKKAPNGALVEGARDALALDLGGPGTVTAVGAFKSAALEGAVSAEAENRTASVRQLLRSQRTAPLRFEVAVAGQKKEGEKADGGMLAVSGPAGSIAVALNHMHRYEPQALRLLPDGRLAIDIADDKAWLAHHQGLFATFAVTALPAKLERAGLDRLLWAPLNRPLRAWPDAAWFTASEAVAEVPAGTLPKKLAAYDEVIPKVLNETLRQVDSDGTTGLMTFGVYPRYWGEKGYPGEIECKDDPTPGEEWDRTFWCGAWTDYHNAVSNAAIWAMRSGDVSWLDEVAVPGALRTLHTQIMQCGPEERWFYCGQAPTGYGAYRTDFNSSHAYFENLFLYYWLTGDSMVVDVVERGGDSMRRFICDSRGQGPSTDPKGPQGPPCDTGKTPKSGASLTGRVGSQWINAFRFLGLASGDPSFLEDYRSGLARALTWNYAELERGGRRYGFLGGDKILEGPGTYEAGPWWTTGFYDAENLYRFKRDTGDAPLGDPAIPPSQALAALARTVVEIGSRQFGDGTPAGNWPRLLVYTWTGPRIGGTLTAVEPKDRELYNTEKAGSLALLARAGRQTGDPALIEAGDDLIRFVLKTQGGDVLPLGKIQGQYLTRLHAAVAVAAEPPPPQR